MNLTMGSLFSGIGGFELAGEACGVRTIWQSEIDPFCTQLLAERFPGTPNLGDITKIDWSGVERPDIIAGGFPCQDISYAGKGAGLEGERSGLWYEYARAIREVGPRYVIVENVRALFTRGFDAVLGTLADLGYDAEWAMYGAADVGAPHRRHRVWILAYRVDDAHSGRREQRDASQRSADVTRTRHAPVGHASSCRRGGLDRREHGQVSTGGSAALGDANAGRELQPQGVVTSQRGRARHDGGELGDTQHSRLEGLAGDGDHGDQPGRLSAVTPGSVAMPRGVMGWSDAVPVRGYDGTVRLIPGEAARQGPESPLWPVADGLPGRVARLRGVGNAIVPYCAVPIFRRIEEIERMMRQAVAA